MIKQLIFLIIFICNFSYADTNSYKLPVPFVESIESIHSWDSMFGIQDPYLYHHTSGLGMIFKGFQDIQYIPRCTVISNNIENKFEYEYSWVWLCDQNNQLAQLDNNFLKNKNELIKSWYKCQYLTDTYKAKSWLHDNKNKLDVGLYNELTLLHPIWYTQFTNEFGFNRQILTVVHIDVGDSVDRTYAYQEWVSMAGQCLPNLINAGLFHYNDLVEYQKNIIVDREHAQQVYNKYASVVFAKITQFGTAHRAELEYDLKQPAITMPSYYSPAPGITVQGEMTVRTWSSDGTSTYQHTKIDPNTGNWYPMNRSIGGMF